MSPAAMTDVSGPAVLDLAAPRPRGLLAVDASAGTGKTYALVAMAVRAVAVGEVGIDGLLLVTFTRAAAAELRERLRAGLVEAAAVLAADDPTGASEWLVALHDGSPEERAARTARLRAAVTGFDGATVTTLHGFCRTALTAVGVAAGAPPARLVADTRALARSALRDVLLGELLAPRGDVLRGDRTPDTLETQLHAALRVLRGSADGRAAPLGPTDAPAADAAADVVRTAAAESARRLRAQGEAGFDDLVGDLHARLHGEGGDAIAATLRARHRLVLVDEHQDTDAVQWAVLRRAFRDDLGPAAPPSDLVFVGDPKQSIYRFRGADVTAYLAARREVDAERWLDRSHRAAPDLVAALNVLLAGADLGEGIAFRPVAAARPPVVGERGPALELRWLAPGPDGYPAAWRARNTNELLGPPTTVRVLDDLAARVVAVLGEPTVPDADGAPRPPRPSEVAVLTRGNAQVEEVVVALAAAGVPAARPRGGSVYDADAVDELRVLLAALADPTDERAVRAVRGSWFVAADPAGVGDPDGVAATQVRLAGWADELAAWGVLALWARLRSDPEVGTALAAAGERGLTDLEHLAELLHVAVGARGVPAAVALRTLDELRLTRPVDDEAAEDPSVRRLASDGDAVQVMTVHRAKGLEWPVVLVPFGGFSTTSNPPYAFTSDAGRIVDAASSVEWSPRGDDPAHPDRPHATQSRRKDLAKAEVVGDAARLLYVALTRARERLVVWWVPTQVSRGSELHRVLFGARDPDGTLRTGPPPKFAELTPPATAAALEGLVDRVRADGGTAAVVDVAPEGVVPQHVPPVPVASVAPAVARLGRNVAEGDVGRWSYTRLLDAAHATAPSGPSGLAPEDAGGGHDEATALHDVEAGGTAFGVVVHRALEVVDSAGLDLEGRLRAHLAGDPAAAVAGDPAALAAALATALATPLDPLLPGRALVDVPARDRVTELRFDLPLADTAHRVDLGRLGRAVAEALGDDPLAPGLADLGERAGRPRIAGWLTGSIDLLVRTWDPAGRPRYTVVDHKTTVLRDAARAPAYGAADLQRAVIAGDHAVQLLLYLVAARRHLRRRHGGDDGWTLDGAGLLFLRGLGGPDAVVRDGGTPGVFAWRPGDEVVALADRILAGADR